LDLQRKNDEEKGLAEVVCAAHSGAEIEGGRRSAGKS